MRAERYEHSQKKKNSVNYSRKIPKKNSPNRKLHVKYNILIHANVESNKLSTTSLCIYLKSK